MKRQEERYRETLAMRLALPLCGDFLQLASLFSSPLPLSFPSLFLYFFFSIGLFKSQIFYVALMASYW
jgi:hypothetical protein